MKIRPAPKDATALPRLANVARKAMLADHVNQQRASVFSNSLDEHNESRLYSPFGGCHVSGDVVGDTCCVVRGGCRVVSVKEVARADSAQSSFPAFPGRCRIGRLLPYVQAAVQCFSFSFSLSLTHSFAHSLFATCPHIRQLCQADCRSS